MIDNKIKTIDAIPQKNSQIIIDFDKKIRIIFFAIYYLIPIRN